MWSGGRETALFGNIKTAGLLGWLFAFAAER